MNIRVITLVSFLFVLMSCDGAEERQEFYLDKAKLSLKNNDYDKAKVDLKNVLQIDPKNSEGIYLFGTVLEAQDEHDAAYKYFIRAVEYDGKNIDAHFRLARIYLQTSQIEMFNKEIAQIEEIKPGHVYVKSLRAAEEYSNKNYDGVIKIFDTIEKSERSENDYVLYALSSHKLENESDSILMLEAASEKYPDNIKIAELLAFLHEQAGNNEKAALVYKKIISVDKTNIRSHVNFSNFYSRNNEDENAKHVYDELVQSDPENEEYQLLRVRYIQDKQGIEKAINHLKSLIDNYPKKQLYKVSIANLYIKNNNNAEAISITKRVLEENYDDKSIANARNILATLAIQNGDLDTAKLELAKVLEINSNDVAANLMFGKIFLSGKQYEEAINSFRVVVREMPENVIAYIYLAKAHESQGSIGLARDVLARGYSIAPNNPEVATSFIELLLKNGEYEYALNFLKSLPSNDNSTLRVLNLKAKVYFANKKYRESLDHATIVIANYPKFEEGYLTAAGSYANLNQLNEASRVLRQGLDLKSSPKLLIGYANLEKSLGHVAKLIEYLKAHQYYKPIVFNLLAELYGSTNRIDKAVYYYNQSISLNPKWDVPYIALAELYKSKDDLEKAIEALESGIESVDDGDQIKLMKADLHLYSGEAEQAVELYDQILDSDPTNVSAINNLALTLVDKFDDNKKLERAYELIKGYEQHESPLVLDTVGWVYARSGRYTDAIFILSGLVKQHPDMSVFKYHLGMAYYYNSDLDNAHETLKDFYETNVNNEAWSNNIKKIADEYKKIARKKDEGNL